MKTSKAGKPFQRSGLIGMVNGKGTVAKDFHGQKDVCVDGWNTVTWGNLNFIGIMRQRPRSWVMETNKGVSSVVKGMAGGIGVLVGLSDG